MYNCASNWGMPIRDHVIGQQLDVCDSYES